MGVGRPLGMVGMSRERTAGPGTAVASLAGTWDWRSTSDKHSYGQGKGRPILTGGPLVTSRVKTIQQPKRPGWPPQQDPQPNPLKISHPNFVGHDQHPGQQVEPGA